MKTVLLIGSHGLLGASLIKVLLPIFNVITVTRTSLNSNYQIDMSLPSHSDKLLNKIKPEFIINLAAITNLDVCENNIDLAYQVNTKIAENIAKYSNLHQSVHVVHISTDHLYDKNMSCESDIVIRNNYAMTKYCAEKSFCLNNATILRTNFFGKSISEHSNGLCNSIFDLALSKKKLSLFSDVFFSPLSINTLCNIIVLCLEKKIGGIYNVGSNGGMSKAEFLICFLKLSGVSNFQYDLVSVANMNFKTNRPKNMIMNVSLFEHTYKSHLPNLMNEIESVANEFK